MVKEIITGRALRFSHDKYGQWQIQEVGDYRGDEQGLDPVYGKEWAGSEDMILFSLARKIPAKITLLRERFHDSEMYRVIKSSGCPKHFYGYMIPKVTVRLYG